MLQVLTRLIQLQKNFIFALKAEVDKLDINKLTNASTSLNNLKTKLVGLDLIKLKTVPAGFKKISDFVDNKFVKTQNSTYYIQK